MTTTTVHRGITYDVTVSGVLPLSSLSLETMFSCSMEIPGTQFSLKKKTMYMHRTLGVKDSQVAGGSKCCVLPYCVVALFFLLSCGGVTFLTHRPYCMLKQIM